MWRGQNLNITILLKIKLLKVVSLFKSQCRNSLAVIWRVFVHVAVFLVNSYLVSPEPFLFYFSFAVFSTLIQFDNLWLKDSSLLDFCDVFCSASSDFAEKMLPPPPLSSGPENNVTPSGLKLVKTSNFSLWTSQLRILFHHSAQSKAFGLRNPNSSVSYH